MFVQSVEHPEEVIPSFVWFEPVDLRQPSVVALPPFFFLFLASYSVTLLAIGEVM